MEPGGTIKLSALYKILLEKCDTPQNASIKKDRNIAKKSKLGIDTPFNLQCRDDIREFCKLYKNLEDLADDTRRKSYRASSYSHVNKIQEQLEKLVEFAKEKMITEQPIVKEKLSSIRSNINERKDQDLQIITEYLADSMDQFSSAEKLKWLEQQDEKSIKKLNAYFFLAQIWGNRKIISRTKNFYELYKSIPERKVRVVKMALKYRDFVKEFWDYGLDLNKNVNKFYEIALDYASKLNFKDGDEYFLLKRFKKMPAAENSKGLTGLFFSAILNHNQVKKIHSDIVSGSLWLFKANNMQISIGKNNGPQALSYIENCNVCIEENNSDAGLAAKNCDFHVEINNDTLLKDADGCKAVINVLNTTLPKTKSCKFYIDENKKDLGLDSRVYLKQDGIYISVERINLKFEFWKEIYKILIDERKAVQEYIDTISNKQYDSQIVIRRFLWDKQIQHSIHFSQLNITDDGKKFTIGTRMHEYGGKKITGIIFSDDVRKQIAQDYVKYKKCNDFLTREKSLVVTIENHGSLINRKFNQLDSKNYENLAKSAENFIKNTKLLPAAHGNNAKIIATLQKKDFKEHYECFEKEKSYIRSLLS